MGTLQRHGSTPRWSEACVFNGLVFLSGQLADDTTLGFAEQLQQTFTAIDKALAMAGSDRSRLLAVTIYIKDLHFMAQLNAAWSAWLPAGCAPGRTTVQATMVDPQCLVEMSVVAAQREPDAR